MPPKALTEQEFINLLTDLVEGGGINGMIERIVRENPGFVDTSVGVVEGQPQTIYRAQFGKIATILVMEFLKYAFERAPT